MVRHNKQINAHDWDETDLHVQGIQRRQHARLEASLHVSYEVGGRPAVAFSQNISQGGMLLRQASGLYAGSELDFVASLIDGEMPLEVRGEVLAVGQQGVRVCFAANQANAIERLGTYVQSQVVPALEAEMTRPISSLQHVVELANLYADQGRHDDAVALYRAQLGKRSRQIALYEHMSRLISTRLVMNGQATEAELTELAQLTHTGLALGDSAALEQAQQVVERFRAQPPAEATPQGATSQTVSTVAATRLSSEQVVVLAQRELNLAARQDELRAWESTLNARDAALNVREASLQARMVAADTELAGRNQALERATAVHTQRMTALESREAAMGREHEALTARSHEVTDQTTALSTRRSQLEERERAADALRAQLEAREHALQAREEALGQATEQLRKQQHETAAQKEEVAQQLGAWQTSYEANVKAWVQRLRQFSATLGVKLTAKHQDLAALNESLKSAQATLTEREMLLAAEQRQLAAQRADLVAREATLQQQAQGSAAEQKQLATARAELATREAALAQKAESAETQNRLAQLHQLLKEAESDIFHRDQAINVLKQTLLETRATLDAKTRLLASLTEQSPMPMQPTPTVPDVQVQGTLEGRVSGQVELGTSRVPPRRLENEGFGDEPTGEDVHLQGRYWEGGDSVINAEEVVDDAEPVTTTMAAPQAPAYKWRVR